MSQSSLASVIHDDELCLCGTDPADEPSHGPACSCECEDCCKRRQNVMYLWRVAKLKDRLDKAGIGLDELATLVWMEIEPTIEARIETLAKIKLQNWLKGLRLVSRVDWSSIED